MKKQIVNEFRYRPNHFKSAILFLLAFGGFCLFVYFAMNPGETPVRWGGIELTPSQFQCIAVTFAVLSPVGLVFLGIQFVFNLLHNPRIAFTSDSLILPKPTRLGVSSLEIEVPFSDIDSVSMKSFVGTARMLQMRRKCDGRSLFILSNMFANNREFETVRAMLWDTVISSQPPAELDEKTNGTL